MMLSIAILLPATKISAQQEAQFTKYMFNTLVFNPAYAGSREHLSVVALYRDQWHGWGDDIPSVSGYDGRPVTQTFSIHTPILNRVGVGLSLVNDRTGARGVTSIEGSYAYRIDFGEGTLSLGLQGGVMNWRADWESLNFKDPRVTDNAFDGPDPSLWRPNFGAGIFFYTSRFYAGISIPHLVNFNLRQLTDLEEEQLRKWAQTSQHLYITLGNAFPIKGEDLIFKPSILIKSVGLFSEFFAQGDKIKSTGAPTSFDIDLSLFFNQRFWLGTSFRSAFPAFFKNNEIDLRSSHDSIDAWIAFYLENGMRIGLAYDYPINGFGSYTHGSFEVMLGYDFGFNIDKIESPRYFD